MGAKIALVTGASGGLGTHVTRALLDAGFTMVGLEREIHLPDSPEPSFVALKGDVSTLEGVTKAVDTVTARFHRIDLLAHLVGGYAGGQSIAETDEETFDQMFDVNVKSAFHLLRAAIPYMRRAGSGCFIAIGARLAVEAATNSGAYGASKAALVSLIRTVAAENKAAGLTANVLLPSTLDTPANRKAMPNADFSRWVQPASVSSLIVWLAGEAGKDVNGAVIPIYGGL